MKRTLQALMLLALAVTGAQGGAAARPPQSNELEIQARFSTPYITSDGGRATLYLSVLPRHGRHPDRRPMNLAVVLDRSGSMGDEGKMEYARAALHRLIDQLGKDDIFSLVIYDDVVEVARRAGKVRDRGELHRLVDRIEPRNATNLGGGLMEGLRQAEEHARRSHVNRVVLLSDGLANRGITDPVRLADIACGYRARGISVTTMGVGLEYNENLMSGLAEAGGGNYYFIESPGVLAGIFRREFNSMASVYAQNCIIEIRLGRGVRLMDVVGGVQEGGDGVVRVPLGDLYAGEPRELTLEVSVPGGSGSLEVARGEVRLEGERRGGSFSAEVRYTKDVAVVERNRDNEAQGKGDIAASTRSVERAMRELDAGRPEEAAAVLREAKEQLAASPAAAVGGAAAEAVKDQVRKLEEYERAVADGKEDARRAKKTIQESNIKTQKGR